MESAIPEKLDVSGFHLDKLWARKLNFIYICHLHITNLHIHLQIRNLETLTVSRDGKSTLILPVYISKQLGGSESSQVGLTYLS